MKLSEIHIRDPFVLAENGKYYLYGTRGETAWETASGLDVYISDDLENWSEAKECFAVPEGFWADKEIWAPEVHKYKDNFYMFVTFRSEAQNRRTQILKSDTPAGPFLPFTQEAVTPKGWRCLDGTFYIGKNNEPYIVFCHEWRQVNDGEICAMRLSDDLKEAVGELKLLFKASYPSWVDKTRETFVTDGPFLYRTAKGTLLMLWSTFSNEKYVQAVAVSDNGEIDGNWNVNEEPIFIGDGGHGMIFSDFNDEKYLILHSPNKNPNERPVLIPIEEKNDRLSIK